MRNKKGLLFSLTVLLLLLFGMPITASADAIEVPIKVTLRNEETKSFINYLNAQRKDLGLTQYTVDSTLMELARQRAFYPDGTGKAKGHRHLYLFCSSDPIKGKDDANRRLYCRDTARLSV